MTSFPDWVRNHLPSVTTASMLTAASSMIIAGVSLYYTLEAQRIDLEYKEVSIRPRLAFALNNTEWDLVLTNYGLGPGLVVDAVVRYGEKCHHANSESNEDWSRSSSAFGDEIIANVYGKIIPPAFWTRTKGAIVSRIPTVGLTVRPGESFDLFTVLTDTIMIPKET